MDEIYYNLPTKINTDFLREPASFKRVLKNLRLWWGRITSSSFYDRLPFLGGHDYANQDYSILENYFFYCYF